MKVVPTILMTLILLVGVADLCAQNTKGKDFWFGFMQNDTMFGATPSPVTLKIYISSSVATQGVVSIPLRGFSQSFTIAANQTDSITIPTDAGMALGSESVQNKAIHITSDDSINVFALNQAYTTSDASLILPSGVTGREYYVMCYPPRNLLVDQLLRPSEFLVVAQENNTLIEIIPKRQTKQSKPGGIPFTVTLNAGEVYQVQSTEDLTGSRIRSIDCKPFAVFSGSMRAAVPNTTQSSGLDHLFEQMYPVSTWGNQFVVVPFALRSGGDIVRVLACRNNTRVQVNGGPDIVLNAGEFREFVNSSVASITSNKAIAVAQFSTSFTYDNIQNGDPFMMMVNANQQMRNDVSFSAIKIAGVNQMYLTIVTPTATISSITLDGNLVQSLGAFQTVTNNPAYSYIRLQISQGSHRILSPNSSFIAYVYGFGVTESYGYCAGSNAANLRHSIEATPFPLCSKGNVYFRAFSIDSVIQAKWVFDNGVERVGNPVTFNYQLPGTYTVKCILRTDNYCVGEDTVYKVIQLEDGVKSWFTADTVCFGIATSFKDSSAGNVVRSKWLFTPRDSSAEKNPTFKFPSSGIWVVKYIVQNGIGCTDTSLRQVVVKESPNAIISPSGVIRQCVQQPVTLRIQQPFDKYLWNNGANTPTIVVDKSGVYSVQVTNSSNCTSTASVNISFEQSLQLSTVNHFLCIGDSVELDVSIKKGTAPYAYEWRSKGVVLSKQNRVWVKPGVSTTYVVSVTDSTNCTVTDSSIVTVRTVGEFDIRGDFLLCNKENNLYTITTKDNCTIAWSPIENVASINASTNSALVSWDKAGIGKIKAKITNTTTGCSIDTVISVLISNTKRSSISINGFPKAQAKTTYCVGESAFISSDSLLPSYQWYKLESNRLVGVTREIEVDSSGTYYLLSVTGTCFSTDTVVLRFEPKPSFTKLVDVQVCEQSSAPLRVLGIADTSVIDVTWIPNVFLNSAQGFEVVCTPMQNITYRVEVRNRQTNCMSADSVLVSIVPVVKPNITRDNDVLCTNESKQLTISPNYSSILWNTGESTNSIIVRDSGFYSVVVSNSIGCKATDSVQIRKGETPVFTTSKDTAICSGNRAVLQVVTPSTLPNVRYQWYNEQQQPLQQGASTVQVVPMDSSIFTCIATDAQGCTYTQTTRVNVEPSRRFSVWIGYELDLNPGDSVMIPILVKSTTPYVGAVDFIISFASGIMDVAQAIREQSTSLVRFVMPNASIGLEYDTLGFIRGRALMNIPQYSTIELQEFNATSCSSVSTTPGAVSVSTCVLEMRQITSMVPLTLSTSTNPFTNYISLDASTSEAGELSVQVYNTNGELVAVSSIHRLEKDVESRPSTRFEIDASTLSHGVYYCRVSTAWQTKTIQLHK